MQQLEIFKNIKKSMGNFPPFYPECREQEYLNCYAYALNLHFPDKKSMYYRPGIISALSKENYTCQDNTEHIASLLSNQLLNIDYHFSEQEIDLIVKQVQCDCTSLGIEAIPCSFSKLSTNKSYKIILCTTNTINGWHFLRESINKRGKKIWTHKPGWQLKPERIKVPSDFQHIYMRKIEFKIQKCLEIVYK